MAVTPDQVLRRAGLLPAEVDAEQSDEGFWELWGGGGGRRPRSDRG